jgi:hypothetical protein
MIEKLRMLLSIAIGLILKFSEGGCDNGTLVKMFDERIVPRNLNW